jgi:DNA-binding MarR family transcriptional regulator
MRASPDGDRSLYELGLLIARSRRLVWTAAARELEANGYAMLSWVLSTYLVNHGPSTQREIATATGQHPAGVSRLLDELEEQRLVRRHRDTKDRRRARVELTARGRASFDAGRPHVIKALRETFSPLSSAERRLLSRLLQKLLPPELLARPHQNARRAAAREGAPLPAGGSGLQPISRNRRSGS